MHKLYVLMACLHSFTLLGVCNTRRCIHGIRTCNLRKEHLGDSSSNAFIACSYAVTPHFDIAGVFNTRRCRHGITTCNLCAENHGNSWSQLHKLYAVMPGLHTLTMLGVFKCAQMGRHTYRRWRGNLFCWTSHPEMWIQIFMLKEFLTCILMNWRITLILVTLFLLQKGSAA